MARAGAPTGQMLNMPRPALVGAAPDGTPLHVDSHRVAHVCESWLIEDRWWTGTPLRRRYWEVVADSGRNLVVFHELDEGSWYRQR